MTESLRAGAEPAPSRIGAELAQARERLGLTLEEIGAALHIRAAYLGALERGCLSELPSGKAYPLAFLRSYAAALGLDAEAMVRRFRAEASMLSHEPALVFLPP